MKMKDILTILLKIEGEIDEIEETRELIIDHIGKNLLRKPIKAEVSFEKYDEEYNFWVVSNEELGVVGVDDTVEKARKVFEEDLYEYYQFYKGIPNNELTERTLRIKEKLIQIFESKPFQDGRITPHV